MSKKESNPPPPGNRPPPPPPPPGPPIRSFKVTFFGGDVETEESKQRTRDYDNFMKGWRAGQGRT